MTYPAQQISISIQRLAPDVYAFISDPANLPKWAAGLSGSIEKVGDDWIAESPLGKVKVKFAEKNSFGVLDHDVVLPTGETFANPMRVFPNHKGSEVVFTLFRRPEMSDTDVDADAKAIRKDLETLKRLLESKD